MNKLKENKVWLTVIGFGVIIVVILFLILQQQKQATPAAQESSYASSVKASSVAQDQQDTDNEAAYAKKAAKMKGHVYCESYTTWTKQDFRNWAVKYNNLSEDEKHHASTNFGTSQTTSNSLTDLRPLGLTAESVLKNDFKTIGYFETVKDFNQSFKGVDPDTIKK
ncbi:hypothetical protein LNP18_06395 [Leuconostoc citreum]|uniref:hypothetical protein n=1 Tax=Leuconostoc citreum TaxID=33964 RepID=UPI002009E113|nr:hypothetical protein [Leuconostoc citreum]MCK8605733.1 hypothetical protein [Leuconostoc citreum]